jgi:hypothetical protein
MGSDIPSSCNAGMHTIVYPAPRPDLISDRMHDGHLLLPQYVHTYRSSASHVDEISHSNSCTRSPPPPSIIHNPPTARGLHPSVLFSATLNSYLLRTASNYVTLVIPSSLAQVVRSPGHATADGNKVCRAVAAEVDLPEDHPGLWRVGDRRVNPEILHSGWRGVRYSSIQDLKSTSLGYAGLKIHTIYVVYMDIAVSTPYCRGYQYASLIRDSTHDRRASQAKKATPSLSTTKTLDLDLDAI